MLTRKGARWSARLAGQYIITLHWDYNAGAVCTCSRILLLRRPSVPATVLFEETFESTALSSKGWYDNTSPVFTSTETIPGSSKAIEFRFNAGESALLTVVPCIRKFTESDSVCTSVIT